MNSTLKILGLGRCAIGLLRKNLLKEPEPTLTAKQEIVFDHHYILNPFPCTQPNVCDDTLQEIGHYQCVPSLQDQFHGLDRIKEYQICIIEIFPPAPLYFHENLEIFACFESFTTELQTGGFESELINNPEHPSHLDPETYIFNLSKLIESVQKGNKAISIILLNAELLYDQMGNQLGSPLLHQIMDSVKRNVLKSYKEVSLLDMNDVVSQLSKKKLCFFETEFPLLYIRHTPDLEPIAVARDCKHASPRLRHCFALAFYKLLMQNGYSCPKMESWDTGEPALPHDYEQRAAAFLSEHNKNFHVFFKDSRLFSQYIGYVLDTNDTRGHENLRNYIQDFGSFDIREGQDLVTGLYHIRTLAAYLFATKEPLLTSLCLIGMRVLLFPKTVHDHYITYVLLWIKNIGLVARQIIHCNKHISAQPFHIFLQRLREKEYLHNHEVVRQVLSFENACPPLDESCPPEKCFQKKIRRVGIFLPRSTPLYMSMFFGLKRGFEQMGIEVSGWTELLEEKALLEFCRQFKPDFIFEMNRSRKQLPNFPQEIPHVCWIVDLMGNEFSYFQGSEILYSFTTLMPQCFTKNTDSYIDWLPPGIDPKIYYPKESPFLYDFSFIGHIPLPWNKQELERPLYPHDKESKIFADFINEYDRLWEISPKQPTPPESLNSMMGRYSLLQEENQDIDIKDVTLRYDILFRSRRINIRKLIIDTILPVSESIAIFGPENWKQWPRYEKFYHRFVEDPNHLREIYQTSRLNIHEGAGLHMRSLDCFASGGCLLYLDVDERNGVGAGLEFCFEKNRHYVELDKEDFSYQLKHLLSDEKHLRHIGLEAAKLTHENHSWAQRAKKIIQDINYVKS